MFKMFGQLYFHSVINSNKKVLFCWYQKHFRLKLKSLKSFVFSFCTVQALEILNIFLPKLKTTLKEMKKGLNDGYICKQSSFLHSLIININLLKILILTCYMIFD